MSSFRKSFIKSLPGDRDWGEFCEWVRTFVYIERGTGLICYRPRDASHFAWAPDPELFAREWNSGSAGRPIQVARAGRPYAHAKIDGCMVAWKSIRLAVGIVDKIDPNKNLPHPRQMTDAEIVQWYGLGYALMRHHMLEKSKAADRERFEAAVLRYEARIGRALEAHEKDIAKAACRVE